MSQHEVLQTMRVVERRHDALQVRIATVPGGGQSSTEQVDESSLALGAICFLRGVRLTRLPLASHGLFLQLGLSEPCLGDGGGVARSKTGGGLGATASAGMSSANLSGAGAGSTGDGGPGSEPSSL